MNGDTHYTESVFIKHNHRRVKLALGKLCLILKSLLPECVLCEEDKYIVI